MLRSFESWRLLLIEGSILFFRRGYQLCLVALLVLLAPPQMVGQVVFRVDSLPTGARPLGVDLISSSYALSPAQIVMVANSGENSLSFFQAIPTSPSSFGSAYQIQPLRVVQGVPAPYAVASCPVIVNPLQFDLGNRVLVTSPADNSVTVIQIADGTVLGKISVGSQPRAVVCYRDTSGAFKGVVSNAGDDSLTMFDVSSLRVESTIPGVAGSTGLHGIGLTNQSPLQAWVAGTQADVVTLVDLGTSRVLTRIPVRQPTSVRAMGYMCVASASDGVNCYEGSLLPTKIFSPPSPQDFVSGIILSNPRTETAAWLASTGTNNSVAYLAG